MYHEGKTILTNLDINKKWVTWQPIASDSINLHFKQVSESDSTRKEMNFDMYNLEFGIRNISDSTVGVYRKNILAKFKIAPKWFKDTTSKFHILTTVCPILTFYISKCSSVSRLHKYVHNSISTTDLILRLSVPPVLYIAASFGEGLGPELVVYVHNLFITIFI